MSEKIENPLGYEKISKLLMKFAVPSVIAMLVSAVYNIVDQIFIGNMEGYLGNAATNVAYPLSTISLAIALLIGTGGAAKQNLLLGAKKQKQASAAVCNSITMLTLSGIFLGVVTLVFLKPLLKFFGATPDVMPYAVDYTEIIALGLPFATVVTGLNHLIRADGSPAYSMVSMVSGAVINTVLDPIFINLWGIKGAAIATVFGQGVTFVMNALYLRKFKHVQIKKEYFKLDFSISGSICALGIASFFNQLAMTVVQIVMNNCMTKYGEQSVYGSDIPLACTGIVMKVSMLIMAVVIGIAQGHQPIVSFNYGAGNYKRVREAYKKAVTASSIVAVVGFVLLQVFPRQILSIFGKEASEEYFRFGIRLLKIYLFAMALNGIQPVTTTFFTAVGKAVKGTFIALTRQVIFLVPLILILPVFFGIDGIMYAGPVADGAAFVLAVMLMVIEFKKMRQLEIKGKEK